MVKQERRTTRKFICSSTHFYSSQLHLRLQPPTHASVRKSVSEMLPSWPWCGACALEGARNASDVVFVHIGLVAADGHVVVTIKNGAIRRVVQIEAVVDGPWEFAEEQ
eukprot:270252-Pleurochrysis_carterae.AAC.1